jgi:hypothetical protein
MSGDVVAARVRGRDVQMCATQTVQTPRPWRAHQKIGIKALE